ncbi:MAG: riboflavin synthase [Deltaproteobacteria bacterium]|nr:riboflavin synthase [Deltaproteobacteria bacterium]
MFTGLVECMGRVNRLLLKGGDARLVLDAPGFTDVRLGESISINGVCLTVASLKGDRYDFDVSEETISRSNLGVLKQGDLVNLERALRLSDRLGGHLVSGHIDAVGAILIKRPRLASIRLRVSIPESLSRYVAPKGSVAVDGISLTVNECESNFFEVNLIPHTVEMTTLQFRKEGDKVNIETDLIGKYVERMLAGRGHEQERKNEGVSLESLARSGFL